MQNGERPLLCEAGAPYSRESFAVSQTPGRQPRPEKDLNQWALKPKKTAAVGARMLAAAFCLQTQICWYILSSLPVSFPSLIRGRER